LLGVGAALLLSGATAAPARTSHPGKMTVGVEVTHFTSNGRKLRAQGTLTAKITDYNGHTKTVHSTVSINASTGGGCRILHLFLNQLHLDLLGLHAHLDKVNLNITGNPHGGVLGSLFCKLARAKISKAVRASVSRDLNRGIRKQRGHALRFTAYFTPQVTARTAANATCPVLDLVVGPLNLQLLGLVVDLNKVHLSITATRGQGTLGDTFCKLADNSTTTTTSTAAAPSGG
jgi:hypothetical protein